MAQPSNLRPQILEYFARINAKQRDDTQTVSEFAEFATAACDKMELSDPQIAELTGTSPSSIGNYKRGKVPRVKSTSFDSFCAIIGVNPIKARKGVIEETTGIPIGVALNLLQKLQGTPLYDAAIASIKGIYASSSSGKSAK